MKRAAAFLIALTALPLSASEGTDRVIIEKKIVTLVVPELIAERCGSKTRACTYFVGQRLTWNCVSSDGGWRIDAQAQFIPIMYLSNGVTLTHENLHLYDIVMAADAYAGELESRTFESQFACDTAASAEAARFNAAMDNFKIVSNRKRHLVPLPQQPLRVDTLNPSPTRTVAAPAPE